MAFSWFLRLLVINLAVVVGFAKRPSQSWAEGKFKALVTFGDSFTDEGRLRFFINNKAAPPVGWDQGVVLSTASGGLSWARYASIYSKATLYNYAVSGAVCSNQITPRFLSLINATFPDIASYELPAFIADSKYQRPNGTKFFSGKPDNTVYAIWIGTNDIGNNAFLTDSQVKGKTVKDYIDCIYEQVGRLYGNGGRYFVLLNLAPLNLFPQYALPEHGGLPATQFFPEKAGKNGTEISGRIQETVAALNQVYKYRTPFEVDVTETWDDIKIANFDVNSLMTDIYNSPHNYLNGTAPLNVHGIANVCNLEGQNCTTSSSRDSFMWYDPLHPGEQTSRIVAKEFVGVLSGKSKYAQYWG
ncbi:GDSL lipase/esterase [Phaeosphaeriaceae sp. PMI808]|nr:GDSL lipase/esterase [Phaeosphaeriaceae sp. PMI808]